ncbi:signal recognition particle 19 kDa protein-like [Clavelina lepadiformis]|uniref:Signal recognition particle 19 kDa protein n=1 Tax=Clavelina lepadiformis TaxID=159417 RepID=A0ABP0EVN0_CLALP
MAAVALSNTERFLCIYPAYLNSKKTIGEGRRVPKNKGCDNPTTNEIKDVCTALGLKPIVENKLYPRELYRGDVTFRGRVRVQLKEEDGSLIDERFPTKKALLLHVGGMIPKLKTRTQKGGSSGDGGQAQSKQKKKKRR